MGVTTKKYRILLRSLLLLIAFLAVTPDGFCDQTKKISKRKADRIRREAMVRQIIERAISDTTYYIQITQGGSSPYVSTLGLPSASINDSNCIRLRNDSLYVNLPYNGAHRSTFRGSGFNISTTEFTYTCVKEKNEERGWIAEVDTKITGEDVETVTITMQISKLGFVSIGVTSTSRDSITFSGRIIDN